MTNKTFIMSGRYFYPDLIQRCYVVKEPFSVICMDIQQHYATIDGVKTRVNLFAAIDLATGKVVAHFFDRRVTAPDIVSVLSGFLNVVQQINQTEKEIILHSDRGTQFSAQTYNKIAHMFPFVRLSMSDYATPVDNAVIERLWRTFKHLKPIWIMATGRARDDVFTSIEDGKLKWKAFIDAFNSQHNSDRNLYLTPNVAEAALHAAKELGVAQGPPFNQFLMAGKNDLDFNLPALDAVLGFRRLSKQAFLALTEDEKQELINSSRLAQIQQSLSVVQNNQIAFAQGLNEKLDQMQNKLLGAIQGKKDKRKREPRPLRTPISFLMQQLMCKNALKPEASIIELRDTLAVLILCGLGCRISEIRSFTLGNVRQLTNNGAIEIMNLKRNRLELKVMSDDHATLIKKVLRMLLKQLSVVNVQLDDGSFVFSALDSPQGHPLNPTHFNDTVNKLLDGFSKQYYEQFGEITYLRSHGARAEFITSLIKAGKDIEIARQMAGHDDIRSTVRYNRFKLSETERKAILNDIKRTEGEDAT